MGDTRRAAADLQALNVRKVAAIACNGHRNPTALLDMA
jgi:hypothetical protein